MRKKILAILIVAILAMSSLAPAIVSADTYVKSGYACKKGSNIYFAFTSTKKSTPIYKFNVKTGQRTKVFPKGKSSLKEFKHLNVLGKYIICAVRPASSLSCSYIYRINAKTGKAKKLRKGTKPTIVNGKIVFEGVQKQKVNDNLSFTYVPSGESFEIPPKGGKKKKVNHTAISVEATCRGQKITSGRYTYYISKDGKKIFRTGGKGKKQICKAKKITGFRVLSGYLIVKTTKNGRNYAYCVKNNGSTSVRILKW